MVEVRRPSQERPLQVRWHLPASKMDQRAEGIARTHTCTCTGRVSPACPAHALWGQLLVLQRRFPQRWSADGPNWDLPLFPNVLGEPCGKEDMLHTIEEAAVKLRVPLAAPDRSERVTGHSLRVTGAQGLARRGWDLWSIQLLGRWGSEVVKTYVRDAPLDHWGMPSSSQPGRLDIDELVDLIVRRLKAENQHMGMEVAPNRSRATSASDRHSGAPAVDLDSAAEAAGATRAVVADLAIDAEGQLPELAAEVVKWLATMEGAKVVMNMAIEVHHAVPRTKGRRQKPSLMARSKCGWRYEQRSHKFVSPEDLPKTHFGLCELCFPAEYRVALSSFMHIADQTEG